MFEFAMSYLDPEYHKAGDKPFVFPPESVNHRIEANIVEIHGRIGSGKTTLLNTLALALGFLKREKSLQSKPSLRHKLELLQENKSLEYSFLISCDKPHPMELRIEQKRGQPQRNYLNSQPIDTDTLARQFDVIFLTEDDPKKVITVSKEKLANYFSDLERRLNKLNTAVANEIFDVEKYAASKNREKGLLDDINGENLKIKTCEAQIKELQELLEKVNRKAELEQKVELLNNENGIESEYKRLQAQYAVLVKKEDKDIIRKVNKARIELSDLEDQMKLIQTRIFTTCKSLSGHGLNLDHRRLADGDWKQYNEVMQATEGKKKNGIIRSELVDQLYVLLSNYPNDEIVPVINKPVKWVLGELAKMKIEWSQDRIVALLNALGKHLDDRDKIAKLIGRAQQKIAESKQTLTERENIDLIEENFREAEKKYLALQQARKDDPEKLRKEYLSLSSSQGDPEKIRNNVDSQLRDAQVAKRLKSKFEEELRLQHEKMSKPPAFENRKRELQNLVNTISALIEKLNFWAKILGNPPLKRDSLPQTGKSPASVDTREKYDSFVKEVGEFLGSQFEPIPFDDHFHQVKDYEIVTETFITKEGRRIPIDRLSQGQSKITALTGSLKGMNPSKKGIVLIDEIAELDLESLAKVESDLKSKLDEGSLLLAVLVRPSYESGPRVTIKGWG